MEWREKEGEGGKERAQDKEVSGGKTRRRGQRNGERRKGIEKLGSQAE